MAGVEDPGPRFVSLEEVPAVSVVGVMIANELLDNLPFRVAVRHGSGWHELRVGYESTTGSFVELTLPAPDGLAELAARLVPDAPVGARIPVQNRACDWLREALDHVERGRVIAIDYASTTPRLARRPMTEWVRTYRDHETGAGPLEALGRQDITVDVCVDQLARVRSPDRDRSQAEFLRRHGLSDLVDEGKRIWHERAHIGDLEAIRGRSRVTEAEALTDPAGLGSFRVLEWDVARP
jgi:SAM-dependent MidA family methyltransferase